MRRIVAAVLLFALAACSGAGTSGGSGNGVHGFVPAARGALTPDHRRHKRVGGYAHIVIPRRHRRKHPGRGPDYVSPSIRGIKIVATWQGGSTSTFVETTVAALGPKAPDCTSTSSGFSCTIPATVWEGPNKIDVTVYDTPPSGSSSSATFPPGAQVLGFSSITQTVTAGVTPSILIYLGGEIGSINAKPLFQSAPADGTSHDVAITFNPKDFGNNKITAGQNDPFANPINVTLTETGGNGHAVLVLNGSGTGSSAKIKFSNDTLAVRYDGGGKPGYTVQVQMAANGAPSEMLQVSPLIVDGPGIASHALGLNGTAVSNALTITEANAPASTAYSVTRSGCTGIATVSGFTGSGSSASFTATGGATGSAGGCSISVSDGTSTVLLPVTNTAIAGGVTINGVRITEFSVGASPGPMAVGPDNNLYVVGNFNNGGNEIIPFKPNSGAPTIGTAVPIGGSQLFDVAAGSDGALWILDYGITGVDRLTTGGALTPFPTPYANLDCPPGGLTAASDGTLWASSCGAMLNLTVGGEYTSPSISPTNPPNPAEVVQGPDGALYIADGNNLDRYDPIANTMTQYPAPGGGFTTVKYLTVAKSDGTSGAIWYTANNVQTTTTSYVVRFDIATLTQTTRATLGTVALSDVINGIAAGSDNAVWFTDSTNNNVDRLAVANGSSVETFPLPTAASDPIWIVRGPDGTLWLSENGVGNIVRVIP